MYAKLLSISDELMWRYYALLTDLTPAEIEAEQAKGRPMASKMALARRIVTDFHGDAAAEEPEREWRRVHQERQAPTRDAGRPDRRGAATSPTSCSPPSGSRHRRATPTRLLRQNAVRLDGKPVPAGQPIEARSGTAFVLSVGPSRFVRIEVTDEGQPPRLDTGGPAYIRRSPGVGVRAG